jgi:cell division septal protein FtsQ
MKERFSKIFGLMLFVLLAVLIVTLGVSSSDKIEETGFTAIEITGCKLLSEAEYLAFSGLKDESSLKEVTLQSVKNEFEKHPYVAKADVEYDGIDKIIVELHERNFMAVIFQKQELKLVTEDFETIAMIKNTEFYELPIIANPRSIKIKSEPVKTSDEDLKHAFRIIDAIKASDGDMYQELAEINLHNGGDVILTFTGLRIPVIFGRGKEAKKILILKSLWNELHASKNIFSEIEYVDLRFNNQILIGKKEKSEISG